MSSAIEVFQDLFIATPSFQMAEMTSALTKHVANPWRYVDEEPVEAQAHGNILFMERSEDATLPGARLVLWPNEDGYSVMNVVPTKIGQLDYATYNALLQEFTKRVAAPAAASLGATVRLSGQWQSVDDWFGPETTQTLQSFSRLANKSTGASHPLDQKRWLNFLIRAHNDKSEVDSELLYRWLCEVEQWPEETALDLIRDYDFAHRLLEYYDESH